MSPVPLPGVSYFGKSFSPGTVNFRPDRPLLSIMLPHTHPSVTRHCSLPHPFSLMCHPSYPPLVNPSFPPYLCPLTTPFALFSSFSHSLPSPFLHMSRSPALPLARPRCTRDICTVSLFIPGSQLLYIPTQILHISRFQVCRK